MCPLAGGGRATKDDIDSVGRLLEPGLTVIVVVLLVFPFALVLRVVLWNLEGFSEPMAIPDRVLVVGMPQAVILE